MLFCVKGLVCTGCCRKQLPAGLLNILLLFLLFIFLFLTFLCFGLSIDDGVCSSFCLFLPSASKSISELFAPLMAIPSFRDISFSTWVAGFCCQYTIYTMDRTVQYRQPDTSQIRDCISAGSLRLRLSGLKSRAHLIRT